LATTNRRDFLLTASAASLATLLPHPLQAQSTPTPDRDPNPTIPTEDTLLKFHLNGTAKPFAGNTVICHLPQQSRTHDAIAALGDELRASTLAPKLGVLPAESLHMTVFSGPNDQGRTRDTWPSDIPFDAPIAEANRILEARVAAFKTKLDLPIRVSVNPSNTLAYGRASTLRISPAGDAENARLRTLRDQLSGLFRLRAQDHATYAFHISIAYQMTPFTAQEKAQYQAILEQHVARIVDTAPVIELGVPEFCTFEDMNRFEIRKLIRL
jgi:hypothetical protein